MFPYEYFSLCTSFDSPLILDSSTPIVPSIKIPSAGITTSPTTTSSNEISVTFPFLLTLHFNFNDSSFSFSKAFSLPYSEILDIKEAKKIAIKIPSVSNQSKSLNKKTTFIASAINNILIIGSPKDSINKDRKLLVLPFLISLVPYFSLLSITSLSLSPFLLYLFIITS